MHNNGKDILVHGLQILHANTRYATIHKYIIFVRGVEFKVLADVFADLLGISRASVFEFSELGQERTGC